MPELPEVETIKTAIFDAIKGKRILDVKTNRDNIRLPIPAKFAEKVKNQVVKNVKRIAKYILIELDNDETIVIHLGMSGRVTITNNYVFKKHDHVVFYFSDDLIISYNDARRFGFVSFLSEIDLSNIGIDALSDGFDKKYLKAKLKNKQTPIKTTMLDQSVVAGLGNIYIIESLFNSKINPTKKASFLTDAEIDRLIKNIKEVLHKAILAGGTTLKDYRKASGELGYFQNELLVYGKEGEKCPVCGTVISRIVQGGRSTFFCPKCQK